MLPTKRRARFRSVSQRLVLLRLLNRFARFLLLLPVSESSVTLLLLLLLYTLLVFKKVRKSSLCDEDAFSSCSSLLDDGGRDEVCKSSLCDEDAFSSCSSLPDGGGRDEVVSFSDSGQLVVASSAIIPFYENRCGGGVKDTEASMVSTYLGAAAASQQCLQG